MGRTREFLDDQVCVVTGATTGIGREVARELALMRATVVLGCRDATRGQEALRDIVEDSCNDRVMLLPLDLASQASIRTFAAKLQEKFRQVHVLINNAAVWMAERLESPDGVELTWATNVLGPFLLTNLLIEKLKESAPARVINVASTLARGLDLEDPEFRRRPFDGMAAYAQSKQALRMLTWGWDARYEGSRVTFHAVHPGIVNTELLRHSKGFLGAVARPLFRMLGRTPAQGADTIVWLASADENERTSGNFWIDRKIKKCPYRDLAAIDRLWALCSEGTRS
ncbi:MAG: SDR family oxidoreductase [Myxococcales bacterium]|nr:SDR family oxidoreductase [Polyangiaceae bacterium]MDW8248760.1 SDR family oxidoreductase [Myxococcales bacterium]